MQKAQIRNASTRATWRVCTLGNKVRMLYSNFIEASEDQRFSITAPPQDPFISSSSLVLIFSRMVKHPRKKQKTSQHGQEIAVQPLGSNIELTDDASKDDEERLLESQLFGVPYVPRGDDKRNDSTTINNNQDDVVGLGKEMENLMDADVCSFFSRNFTLNSSCFTVVLCRRRCPSSLFYTGRYYGRYY